MGNGFSVTFYKTASNPFKIDKVLTDATPITNAKPNTPCNVLTPQLIINYNSAIANYNYCILGAPFNRCYFVGNITLDSAHQMIVPLSVDVMSTYGNGIKNANGVVTRSSKYSYPTLYIDSQLPVAPNKIVLDGDTFSGAMFNTNATQSFLLTTIGSTNNP